MTDDEKLMQQALETLEFIRRVEDLGMVTDGTAKQNITALRERLAQSEREPLDRCEDCGMKYCECGERK